MDHTLTNFLRTPALAAAALLAAWAGTAAPAPKAPSNSDCLECHGDKTLSKTNAAGKAVSLFVDAARYTNSVHRTNACVSCHGDVTAKHPDDNVTPRHVDCAICASMALASSLLPAEPPTLPRPSLSGRVAIGGERALALAAPPHRLFQTRAPPSA